MDDTRVEFACENPDCDVTGSVGFGMPVTALDVGNEITVSQPCPACGGKLSAPGGHYERDADGILRRTGDFRPQFEG